MDFNNIINFDTSGAVVFSIGIFVFVMIAIVIISFSGKHKSK